MIKLLTRLKTLMFICVLLAFIGPFFVNKISSNVGIAWQLDYVSAFVTALAFTSIPLAILQWLALQVPDDQATLNWITLIFSILGSALYIFIAIVLFIPAINNHLPSTFSTDLGLAFIGLAL